jgi:hypothetical protein
MTYVIHALKDVGDEPEMEIVLSVPQMVAILCFGWCVTFWHDRSQERRITQRLIFNHAFSPRVLYLDDLFWGKRSHQALAHDIRNSGRCTTTYTVRQGRENGWYVCFLACCLMLPQCEAYPLWCGVTAMKSNFLPGYTFNGLVISQSGCMICKQASSYVPT